MTGSRKNLAFRFGKANIISPEQKANQTGLTWQYFEEGKDVLYFP